MVDKGTAFDVKYYTRQQLLDAIDIVRYLAATQALHNAAAKALQSGILTVLELAESHIVDTIDEGEGMEILIRKGQQL